MDGGEVHICATDGCCKAATMHCPTCIKKGLPPTYFCSQDCFKTSWSDHKKVHKAPAARKSEAFPPFEFDWTGPLRAAPIVPGLKDVPSDIPRPDYAESGVPMSELAVQFSPTIEVKTVEQIAGMRRAGRIAREVLDTAGRAIRDGITGEELDEIVHQACIERGGYPSPLNYRNFPKSVCVSPNEVVCHGIPDQRPLQCGDIVNLDVTVFVGGFHGDVNETYFVGDVDQASRDLVQRTYECLDLAIAAVQPGTQVQDFGNIISKHARKHGLSVVKNYTGHGIGNLFHTAPTVPHYNKNKAHGVLKPGMTFTIEPMINIGGPSNKQWPDEWTVVTADGQRSAQFEQTLLVTEDGVEVLTARLSGVDYYDAPQFFHPPAGNHQYTKDPVAIGSGSSAVTAESGDSHSHKKKRKKKKKGGSGAEGEHGQGGAGKEAAE